MRIHEGLMAVALAGFALGATAAPAPAALPWPAFPAYRSPAAVEAACDAGLAGAEARVQALQRRRAGTGWVAAMDDLNAYIEDVSGPIFVLTTVHPDKTVRGAAEACELRWQDFSSSLGQNEALYRHFNSLHKRVGSGKPVERHLITNALRDFKLGGVTLTGAPRQRFREVMQQLAAQQAKFEQNVMDATDATDQQLSSHKYLTAPNLFTLARLCCVPVFLWLLFSRNRL